MKFEKLEIENYRQYRKESIELASTNPDKQFSIIEGANGTGKTNILNAITWCLYGEEFDVGNKNKGKPFVNEIALGNAKDGEAITVNIRLIAHDEKVKIIFFRSARYEKTGNNAKLSDYHPMAGKKGGVYFQVSKIVSKDVMLVDDPEYIVQKMFPRRISKYFFFNGEKLDEYFRMQANEKIKEEVFNISQLHLFEKVNEHLTRCRDEFSRDLRGVAPSADKIKKELDEVSAELAKNEDKLKRLNADKKMAQDLIDEFVKKLQGSSKAHVKGLQAEREQLEKELDNYGERLLELESERLDYFLKSLPAILGFEAILEAHKILGSKVDSGEIPPDYKRGFIQQLIDKGQCICGTNIAKGSSGRKKIEQLLNDCKVVDSLSEEIIIENHNMSQLSSIKDEFPAKQQKYSKDIGTIETKVADIDKRLKKIGDELKGINADQVDAYERQRELAQGKKDEIIGELAIVRTNIEGLTKRVTILNDDYTKEIEKISKHNKLKEILLFCEHVLKATVQIKDEIMEEIRKQIESETKKQFFELIWKKKSFKDVKIDPEYNISVIDIHNRESIGTLSAGERQVLALSFMSALNIVSGFDSPIIIDTPLGRISTEPRENIAENLPEYLKNKQVLLLVTEEEYSKNVRLKMKKAIGKEYKINFIESSNGNEAKVVAYDK